MHKAKTVEERKRALGVCILASVIIGGMFLLNPAWATSGASGTIREILDEMIGIVGTIFTAVGVFLAIYSVGNLIFAFKNDDPDSKQRATTLLVVSIALIGFPQLVEQLNLVQYIS